MNRSQNHALFALRVILAAIFLWHGAPKAIDIGGAIDKFIGLGLPGVLGPITGWAEVIASLALLAGFRHQLASAALAFIIVGALLSVQIPNGIQAGLERDVLILVGTAIIFLFGAGSYAVDKS